MLNILQFHAQSHITLKNIAKKNIADLFISFYTALNVFKCFFATINLISDMHSLRI